MKSNTHLHDCLKVEYPQVAGEWDTEKNYPLLLENVLPGSTKKAWWLCNKGHSYYARIDHRVYMHSGCPYCHGKKVLKGENDLKTLYPEIADEWNYSLNNSPPEEYFAKSNKEVYWQCHYCDFSYKMRICDRTLKYASCPNCRKEKGTSFQEQSLLFYLKQSTKALNRYRLFNAEIDIYLPDYSTGIEYNGWYYHKNRQTHDEKKIQNLQKNGIRVIIVKETTDLEYFDDVITVKCSKNGRVNDKDLEKAVAEVFDILGIRKPSIDLSRDHIQIKEQYIISRKENSLAAKYPDIASEWDAELNGSLKAENFQYASNHIACWKCNICDSSYRAQISKRTVGKQGCPYCAGKRVKVGFNDLKTTYPEIASQWSSKNGDKKPEDYVAGSEKKAWWDCDVCGETWEASIYSRTKLRTGCPVCAGRKVIAGYNDLLTKLPEIAAEWDDTKNGELTSSDVTPGSNRLVWWKCNTCGNEWKAAPASRIRGRGCPSCSLQSRTEKAQITKLKKRGSLLEKCPELAEEWDHERNGNLTPDKVMSKSSKKVWWLCKNKHSWQAVIYSRKYNGCPYCSKKKN